MGKAVKKFSKSALIYFSNRLKQFSNKSVPQTVTWNDSTQIVIVTFDIFRPAVTGLSLLRRQAQQMRDGIDVLDVASFVRVRDKSLQGGGTEREHESCERCCRVWFEKRKTDTVSV